MNSPFDPFGSRPPVQTIINLKSRDGWKKRIKVEGDHRDRYFEVNRVEPFNPVISPGRIPRQAAVTRQVFELVKLAMTEDCRTGRISHEKWFEER